MVEAWVTKWLWVLWRYSRWACVSDSESMGDDFPCVSPDMRPFRDRGNRLCPMIPSSPSDRVHPSGRLCKGERRNTQKGSGVGTHAHLLGEPARSPGGNRKRASRSRPARGGGLTRSAVAVFFVLQALRDDDEVVRAAHSLRSASSPPSTAMELPFQGADDDRVSARSWL